MFLKQHSVFDVLTAIVMAVCMYRLVYVSAPFRIPAAQQRMERKLRRI